MCLMQVGVPRSVRVRVCRANGYLEATNVSHHFKYFIRFCWYFRKYFQMDLYMTFNTNLTLLLFLHRQPNIYIWHFLSVFAIEFKQYVPVFIFFFVLVIKNHVRLVGLKIVLNIKWNVTKTCLHDIFSFWILFCLSICAIRKAGPNDYYAQLGKYGEK